MKLKRDYLTPEEVLAVGNETLDKLLDVLFLDLSPGEKFFMKASPGNVHVVQDLNTDGYIYSEGVAEYSDVYPIFSAGMLIQLLSDAHQCNLVAVGLGWVLIWSNDVVTQSEEDELLVSFLWRSLVQIVEEGKYTW
ncbi:hypothetical protein ABIE27_004709 [Paenibacillus sp. 4624]|uniref:hypothetical protein n=1 Tax=Paenibacillus sp. 4624 TaxID=3156453 RepID=UPI003D1E578C